MKTQFDIHKILEQGKIRNELELEQALIADRKLRLLAKEDPKWKSIRKELRDLIQLYENANWQEDAEISTEKLKESDLAEEIAAQELIFLQKRKALIKAKLKSLDLNQQQLGMILGHKSKTYMSELMNGISPFSLKDLIIINRLLKIDLKYLIPTFLPQNDRIKVRASIEKLGNPKIKLSQKDFATA